MIIICIILTRVSIALCMLYELKTSVIQRGAGRVLVPHGFELVVELEGVVTVVQQVGTVPDNAAPREDPAILPGGHCGHVVDEPRPLLVVVELHAIRVRDLVVVGGGVEGVHHHVLLPGVPVQLCLEESENL